MSISEGFVGFSTEVSKTTMITPDAITNTESAEQLPRSQGKFLGHVLTLITGTGLAQVVNVLGTLVLARYCAPDEFGSLALFLTLVSFLSVLGGARYELAVMLPEEDKEAANVLFLAVLILLGISGVCLGLVAAFHSPIARLLGDERLRAWLWCVPLALFVTGLYQVLSLWYARMKRFRRLAIIRVAQAVGIVAAQLGLLAIRPGAFALVAGWFLGQTFGTLLLILQLGYYDGKFLLQARNWKMIRNAAVKYRNFPAYKAPNSFISNAASQLVVVIVRIFSSLETVGLYSMAARAVYLPVSLIASSMNDVFYEKAATEIKHGRLEAFVTRLLRIQVVLAAPVLVLIAFDAKLIFGFVLGPKWIGAGTYAAILSFASFLYFLTSWLDRLFDVRGRQKLSLILETLGNGGSLVGLAWALWWRPQDAVAAVAVYAVLQVVYASIWLVFAYRIAGFHPSALRVLLRDAVISLAATLAVVAPIHILLHGWPAFLLSGLAVSVITAFAFVRHVHTGHAVSNTADRFRRFWADKKTTLNGREGHDFRAVQAAELTNLFPSPIPARVLEIGCGDGNLFPYFGIQAKNYKGVDFSPQFIEKFRSREPGLQLECAEGASYFDKGAVYDVVLLNAIVQHFDRAMLERHVQNARAMLNENGLLIWGSIPEKKHRRLYDSGQWSGGGKPGLMRLAKSWIYRLMGMDAMGFWYEPDEIAALARKYGLQTRIVPSELYPYRFHAVLSRITPQPASAKQTERAAAQSVMVRVVGAPEYRNG
jgi:O-antigen/teichoic acid export membrane protein/SAM-dependent methyltransferase